MELGRSYWGTQSPAGHWREKTDVVKKKRGIESPYWVTLEPRTGHFSDQT